MPIVYTKSRRTRTTILVVLAALVLAVAWCRSHGRAHTLGTFRTDNLLVDDHTTFGSGGVANFPTSACAVGSAATGIGSNGAVSCAGGLTPSSGGSLAVAVGSASSPINLSTLGTVDWVSVTWVGGTSSRIAPCPAATSSICAEKLMGEGRLIVPGVDWIGNFFASGSVSGIWTFTSNASDSLNNLALSSPTVYTGSTTGATGMGIRFLLPSPGFNKPRVARVYTYQYDAIVTCNATALDASAAGSGGVVNTGSGGVVSENVWTVSYSLNTYSYVAFICTITSINTGPGNPAIGWAAISLGTV